MQHDLLNNTATTQQHLYWSDTVEPASMLVGLPYVFVALIPERELVMITQLVALADLTNSGQPR